ncbi:MAG: hypothetical protein J5I50_02750 [Chitinophagaceae bacterium]|nr:hypothetical protein [Chitinophagaceae bacterium]
MAKSEEVIVPRKKKVSKVDKSVRRKLKEETGEEGQVIVHCSYYSSHWGGMIRIWKSTFLCPHESGHRSKLIHAENITLYPAWQRVEPYQTARFTLIFSPLPKGCKVFDLLEIIPESNGFEVRNIKRNKTDVYRVAID